MNIRKRMKALLSLCLATVIAFVCFLPSFAAVVYPENVTKEQTLAAIDKTDTLLYSFFKVTQNSSLKETVLPELYGDNTLSSLLTEFYSMIEEQAGESLSSVGIDASVSSVASYLTSYGDVSEKLSAFSTWSEADLSGAKWGVDSKKEFAEAVTAMLTPFNELIYTLFCSGSYHLNPIIGIKGSNGYETAIIPTLKAFGCRNITSPDDYYSDAQADSSKMIYNIVLDLLSFIEEILDAPCDRLTDILPSIADYLLGGGFDSAVSSLIEPLKLQIFNISTFITVDSILNFISDSESYTQNFSLNFNDVLSGTGIKMAEIDLELLASCGTASGDTVVSDKADTFIVLLRWLIDTVKLNKDSLSGLVPETGSDSQEMISAVFSKDTDSLISFLISLLTGTEGKVNEYQWTFKEFTPAAVAYTPNLNAEKYQRVADNIDEVINELVAEISDEKSLSSMLKKEIYSSSALTAVIKGIYGTLEGEEMAMLTSMLGIDTSPRNLAEQLSGDGHKKAAKSLYSLSSWKSVGEEGIDWGIKTGSKKQFTKVLISALSPLEDVLGMLLAEDSIEVLGAVNIYGSNGYNTAIIPIYEALGCEPSTIRTYEEYKALYSSGKGTEALLEPLLSLVDRIIEKPVYTVLSIVPNLLYFADGGLMTCVQNLLYPFNDMITTLGLTEVINMDEYENLDVKKLVGEFTSSSDMGIALPEFDVAQIASLGIKTEMTSKRIVNGQFITVPYIKADMPALSVTLLRIISEVMKTPGNESLMGAFMGAGGEDAGNEMFASFSLGIGAELEKMSDDETVEWLYKLFFRERATIQVKDDKEEYMPTIIYKPVKDYTFAKAILVFFVFILIGAEIAVIRNREKLRDWIREVKWQRFIKKYQRNQEV